MADLGLWMDRNMLKLNQEKTKLIAFSLRYKSASEDMTLTVGDNVVSVVPCVRNLGVMMDHHLTMEKQVNTISKACYYQLSNMQVATFSAQNTYSDLRKSVF